MSLPARYGATRGVDPEAVERLRQELVRACPRALGPHVRLSTQAQALLIELHIWDEVRLETAAEEKALAELERLDLAHALAEDDAASVVRASARGGELMVEVGVWAMLDRLRRSLSGVARMSQARFDALDASDRAFLAQAVIQGLSRGRFVDGEPITDRDLRLALSFFRFRGDRGRVRRLQAELRERRALAKRESV